MITFSIGKRRERQGSGEGRRARVSRREEGKGGREGGMDECGGVEGDIQMESWKTIKENAAGGDGKRRKETGWGGVGAWAVWMMER